MSKVRINDLARELEVKSKAILDVLPKVGVTEKKTHSSSVEADEAERVKKFFAGQGGGGAKESAAKPDAPKPKFDFSKISKPGDIARAITKKAEPPAVAKAAPPAPAAIPAKPGIATKTPAPKAIPPSPKPKVEEPVEATAPVAAKPEAVAPEKEVAKAEAPTAPKAAPPVAAAPAAPEVKEAAPAPTKVQAPMVPAARRIITPQTGPRPVYAAPVRPASAPPAPGAPSAGARPTGGLPVRGQPIFQRPRPQFTGGTSRPSSGPGGPGGFTGTPGSRPPFVPGQRRPMHPTRTSPTGTRPPGMGGGPGLPPPPGGRAPGQRPGGPSRRPGQRYVPRGVKEGPMKGFSPQRAMPLYSEPLPITKTITITEGISVKDLAEKLEIRAKDVIARLLVRGVFATVNQNLEPELAREMANHFGAEVEIISFEEQVSKDVDAALGEVVVEAYSDTGQRPPVVTIMGHVDHGKTSLLDAIRETEVAAGEAGGITQHIGAYKVRINKKDSPAVGREITFLDTPGHEAFTRMRARGAKVTDIVVLVVAADDGVMPQTIEAIDHATAAKVPLIVAVNKIDKPDAMPDRVKKQLADRGLMPEDWGGTTVFVDVSAKKKTNLDLLMEMICLVADIQQLKATPERAATGSVIEAKLDRGRGAVATILVQNGTLRTGDTFVVGNTFGKVRAMFDDRGKAVDEAPPSTPVEVLGLEGLPTAGDQIIVVADRDKAKEVSQYREMKAREAQLAKSSRVSLESLAEQIRNAGMKELPIILKGDVGGSVEVLADTLTKLSNEQVKIKILHTGVGAITETDVLLASASNAIIIGFNVRPERKAQEIAEQEQVDIRLHSIIYELQSEIKKAMTGLLEPIFKETYLGRAEVRDTFKVPKAGTVAGCFVQDGVIKRDSEVRLLRDNVQLFKGKIASLRRFKDDAKEVTNGMECGIGLANFNDVKVGDVIEAFSVEKVAAELTAPRQPATTTVH